MLFARFFVFVCVCVPCLFVVIVFVFCLLGVLSLVVYVYSFGSSCWSIVLSLLCVLCVARHFCSLVRLGSLCLFHCVSMFM